MTTTPPKTISFRLNGEQVSVSADHPHLLAALREELDVTSPKDGCSPSGQCGSCTVLLDGKARVSCSTTLDKVADQDVTTLEGFEQAERERLANGFAAHGALQCGFCIPGILVRAKALIDQKGPSLDRATIEARLGAHLCRCTGYTKIIDAVTDLARGESFQPAMASGIGKRGAKYLAADLALGDRGYVDDLRRDGLLHAALVFTQHARADIVAIDTSPAESMEGFVAAFTAADVPGELKVGIIHQDWPVFIPVGGRTSFIGDVLAIVVAQTRAQARAAAEAVGIEYQVLDPFTDPAIAIASDIDAVWGLEGNVLSRSAYTRGDTAAALEASAHVVRERFVTQRVEHAFLEPESTLAEPTPDGTLMVYSGGQGIWDDRDQIARVLGVDADQVVVELISNGGAFGGKEDMSNQAQTALAAHLLQRPVKCTLSRTESFRLHPKRHPITIDLEVGSDEDGVLTAHHARLLGDSGPYASVGMKVLERAAGHATGPYAVPNVDVEAIAARTNNPVGGAFRGFGANQAQFAMEGALDRLAEKVGISGWEIRARNVITPGVVWGPGQVMDEGSAGARACLDKIAPYYDAAREQGKAIGLGLALKNAGLGNGAREVSRARIRFDDDGTVEVRHGWTEMGQGVDTIALQVVAEELGVDPTSVRVVTDTTRELGAGQTTGSRGTVMAAGALSDACKAAEAGGRTLGVEYEGEYVVDWTNSMNDEVENPVIHSTFSYAAQLVIADPDTGEIEKVVAVHDVGKAINPTLCEGQIEGSVHMGLGYALTEEFPTDELGRPTKDSLRSLGILRPKDTPQIEAILVEVPQPKSPYGVKGIGEIGLVPTAGAVAAALHEVDGVWRDTLPMSVYQPVDANT